MFAAFGDTDASIRINLKCDPDEAMALRDVFEGVLPGYHLNKRHWNTVLLQSETQDSDVPDGELERMIDNSYNLVVKSMTRKQQTAIFDNKLND